jgi:uncharacterized protein
VQIAGFRQDEADRLFGKPQSGLLSALEIRLRPPVEVRRDFVRRHDALVSACPQ